MRQPYSQLPLMLILLRRDKNLADEYFSKVLRYMIKKPQEACPTVNFR